MSPSGPINRFLVATAVTLAVGFAAMAALFYLQMGSQTRESLGRCGTIGVKVHAAESAPTPKLLFIGGSSVHWGINAKAVAEQLGFPGAANFGTFAALGPGPVLHEAKKVLKPGDVAVLALEYESYARSAPSAEAVDHMLACGGDYFQSLSLLSRARIILSADMTRVLRLSRGSPNPDMRRFTATGDPPLDPAIFAGRKRDHERIALYKPLVVRFNAKSPDVSAIADFVAWARAHRVRVVATWPNTLYFKEYGNSAGIRQIRRFYEEQGVPIAGTPEDALFGPDMLFDTQYHLNLQGIRLRTARLSEALKPILAQPGPPAPLAKP